MGLKRSDFQDVGLTLAFAGVGKSTGIPQGGAGTLAGVCCIRWEEGKPGSKVIERTECGPFCRN